MAKTLKINGVNYSEVKKIEIPLADGSGDAVFSETSDATAKAASIKNGETAYVNGAKIEGTMPLNGAGGGTIANKDDVINIPEGHYSGGGTVVISSAEKAKLVANNIRQGVSVLGVTGSMSPSEGVNAQSKTVTPTKSSQVVQPDNGYTHLTQVTVDAIPAAYITTSDATAVADDIKNGETAYVNGKKITGTHTDPEISLTSGVLSIS